MKKLLLIPLILFLGISSLLVWFYINIQPVSKKADFKNFLIAKGSSAGQIASKLKSEGLIKNDLAFKIYVQISGKANKMQTGEFRLSPSFNLIQTVDTLLRGPIEIWVTIPEGLRREEIAARFTKSLDRDSLFFNEFLEASKNDEGVLFPDTYLFPKDSSASAVVNKMVRTFGAKTSGLNAETGLTFDQRIVLASLIERETKTAEERPIVAGILINRLNTGMALQVDATTQYALANVRCKISKENCDWWQPILKADLAINSTYNTYKFPGLPPGAICNPGLSSIGAAFAPVKSNYWYYIHDKEGKIHYASTLEEQNANVKMYLTGQ